MSHADAAYEALQRARTDILAEMERVRREQLALDQRYGGLEKAAEILFVTQNRIQRQNDADNEGD